MVIKRQTSVSGLLARHTPAGRFLIAEWNISGDSRVPAPTATAAASKANEEMGACDCCGGILLNL
jgi:hypothetical protein